MFEYKKINNIFEGFIYEIYSFFIRMKYIILLHNKMYDSILHILIKLYEILLHYKQVYKQRRTQRRLKVASVPLNFKKNIVSIGKILIFYSLSHWLG